MRMENGRWTEARFLSSKKDLIAAIWQHEESQELEEILINVDLENELYVQLLETYTTDEISTMTTQKAKEEQELFLALVKQMALDYGLVYDPNAAEGKDSLDLEAIFNPTDDDAGTDLLFNIKLKIFEMDAVVDSEDSWNKKKLREAKTPLEAFYIAGKFLFPEE